ncbi:MFS transporter [Neobacillus sp. SM06]|uniref:MFS transporter n=1 Tax=Neobacillus sp. SM06 TaxID=3422492 RepID=UPI003D28480F
MKMNTRNRLWIYSILGMFTTIVVLAFARLSYGVFLPFMRESLRLSYKQAGYLGTTTSLGYLSTIIFAGILASKWGSKKTILLGISLVTVGLSGLAVTVSYWVSFLFMLVLGIGTSFTYTPFISLLVAWFPQKKGLVIGLTTSGAGIGILFAGIVVPFLENWNHDIGWRVAWALFAVIGLFVVVLTFIFIKEPPADSSSVKSNNKNAAKEIYKNPSVINVGLIYGIVGLTYIVQTIFIMSFMIFSEISVKAAGQLMAVNGILSIFSGPIWGAISDRLGRRRSLTMTMGLTGLSMILPVLFPSLIGFAIHIIILSCTSTGLFALTQASSMDHVRPAEMPIAFSYVTFYFAVGQFIGPAIAGWLIDEGGGFKSAFIFSFICLAFGLLLTLKVKNSHPSKQAISYLEEEINELY